MAHFAEIDLNNIVLRVLVVADEHEHRGQEFLANDCNLGGTWIQTSYNSNIRGIYAGVGFSYNADKDIFVFPQPYPSWIRNGSDWNAPVARPMDGKAYKWLEDSLAWEEVVDTRNLIVDHQH